MITAANLVFQPMTSKLGWKPLERRRVVSNQLPENIREATTIDSYKSQLNDEAIYFPEGGLTMNLQLNCKYPIEGDCFSV